MPYLNTRYRFDPYCEANLVTTRRTQHSALSTRLGRLLRIAGLVGGLAVDARGHLRLRFSRAVTLAQALVEVEVDIPRDGGHRHRHDDSHQPGDLAAHNQHQDDDRRVELDAVALDLGHQQVVFQ